MYSKLQNVNIGFLDTTVHTVQKPYVYILQLVVHTVQLNWISRLGRYLMGLTSRGRFNSSENYLPLDFLLAKPSHSVLLLVRHSTI